MEGEKRRTPILLGTLDRVGVLLFSASIHLKTEAAPASETLILIFYRSKDG
jgi:hypothetical protein